MEQADALDVALSNTARLVAGIGDEQWLNDTPCSKWNVRQLVTHTAGVMANFTSGARSKPIPGDPDDYDLGPDAAAAFAELAAADVEAWRSRGELDSIVQLGDNEFPGGVAISINALDAYIHGWDIAQATGQDAELDATLCAGLLEFSKQAIPPSPRDGDRFHAVVPTPDEAGPVADLLGYLGRQP